MSILGRFLFFVVKLVIFLEFFIISWMEVRFMIIDSMIMAIGFNFVRFVKISL